MSVIEVRGLTKRFGGVLAVDQLSFEVEPGTVVGFLGRNGAGKTTTLRMILGLVRPDGGTATINGHAYGDLPEPMHQVGAVLEASSFYPGRTARSHLRVQALAGRADPARIDEVLALAGLTDAADRVLKGYSGGMRRRLDLAAGLVMRPPVLFLDEPTTGLDPTGRVEMWQIIRELVSDGATLLLTTQYLDEADELADRIAVIDHGSVIAEGTPGELKAATGGARLEVTLSAAHSAALTALAPLVDGRVDVSQDGKQLKAAVRSGSGLATAVVRALDSAGVLVDDVQVRPPSLDDVFFALTGRPADDETTTHEPVRQLQEVSA